MTQKQIEQTRVIAEYDGWEYIPQSLGTPETDYFRKDSKMYPPNELPYLTDLNALRKVAMDVMQELTPFSYTSDMIHEALTSRPINGEYIDLFNAVYDGIVYINQSKTTPQERG